MLAVFKSTFVATASHTFTDVSATTSATNTTATATAAAAVFDATLASKHIRLAAHAICWPNIRVIVIVWFVK